MKKKQTRKSYFPLGRSRSRSRSRSRPQATPPGGLSLRKSRSRSRSRSRSPPKTIVKKDFGKTTYYIKTRFGKKKHREGDLPAVIYSDGTKEWYKNGKLHRVGKPAVILRYLPGHDAIIGNWRNKKWLIKFRENGKRTGDPRELWIVRNEEVNEYL